MVFRNQTSDVDQILQVKTSEVDTRNFSSISGWKATELTMSVWPVSSYLWFAICSSCGKSADFGHRIWWYWAPSNRGDRWRMMEFSYDIEFQLILPYREFFYIVTWMPTDQMSVLTFTNGGDDNLVPDPSGQEILRPFLWRETNAAYFFITKLTVWNDLDNEPIWGL